MTREIIPTNDLERQILSHFDQICDGLQDEAARNPFDFGHSFELVLPHATAIVTLDADFESEYSGGQRLIVCSHISQASIEAWDDDENELTDDFEARICKAITRELSKSLLWKEVA